MSLEQTPSDKKSLAAPTPTDGEGLSQAPQLFTVFISVSTIRFSHHSDTLIIPHLPGEGCWILSELPPPPSASSSSSSSFSSPPPAAGPQLQPSSPSVWLPDLNHGHHSPVLAAGPQPRPAPPSVGCRTSTTAIPGAVLAAGPQPPCQI